MEYKTDDGWDLKSITPLAEAVEAYESMSDEIYELKNCVRTMTLVEIRDTLMEKVQNMTDALGDIDDDDAISESSEVKDGKMNKAKLLFKGCRKLILTGVPPMTQNCCKQCSDLYDGAVPEYILCKECQKQFANQKETAEVEG